MKNNNLDWLRKTYPAGTRVVLVEMLDLQAPKPGTCGTVLFVDDIGTIHMRWDSGGSLGLVPGIDRFAKIEG